jgi:hypothetical protein
MAQKNSGYCNGMHDVMHEGMARAKVISARTSAVQGMTT